MLCVMVCIYPVTVIVQLIWSVLAAAGVEGTGDLTITQSTLLCCSLFSVPQLLVVALKSGAYRLDMAVPLGLGFICFVPLGAKALVSLPQTGLRMALGALFLVVSLYQLQITARSTYRAYSERRLQLLTGGMGDATDTDTGTVPAIDKPTTITTDSASAESSPVQPPTDSLPPPSDQPTAPTSSADANAPPSEAAPPPASDCNSSTSITVSSTAKSSESDDQPLVFHHSTAADKLRAWLYRVLQYTWAAAHTRMFWIAFLVGCLAGLIGGFSGAWGPPVMIFYSYTTLTKEEIRGTNAITSAISLPVNFGSALYYGAFRNDAWPAYVQAPILITIFTYVGVRLQTRVDTPTVLLALQGLILLGSLSMSTPADGSVYGWITLALYIVATSMLLAIVAGKIWISRHSLPTPPPPPLASAQTCSDATGTSPIEAAVTNADISSPPIEPTASTTEFSSVHAPSSATAQTEIGS